MKTIFLMAAAACAFAAPAYAAPTFRIDSLTASNASIREVNTITGDDRGGMAVSGTRVFLNGDGALGSFAHDLSGGANVASPRDGIFMNVRDQSVWTLATSATTPYNGYASGGTITHIIQLDPVTGATTGTAIALSAPVTLSAGSGGGIFSGYDRVLYRNVAGAVVKIDTNTGAVSNLGTVAANLRSAENHASWGVAEIFGGDEYLTYSQGPNYPAQNIVRTRISDGMTSTVATFTNLSDLASFAVSPTDGRWYFHYEGLGQFGGSDETLGYATATYTIAADQTGAVPEPATWAMMMLGFGGMGYAMRRKKVGTRIRFA